MERVCAVANDPIFVFAFAGGIHKVYLDASLSHVWGMLQMSIMTRLYPCKTCADHFKEILK